ncbi:MAG: 3'-5' exonuclease, partial [Alphaproteobacteria bacterium]
GDQAVLEHRVSRTGVPGRVELWPLAAPVEDGDDGALWDPPVDQRRVVAPVAALARRIARTIARWIAARAPIGRGQRPIRAGDVMILVRRRAAFAALMVRALKTEGVPVAGIDRMVLTEQIAVMDLLALLRFVLLPEDDLNLAALLKSPLVGLDEEALLALAAGRGRTRLWTALVRRRDERPDFRAAHDYMAERRDRADTATPFDFLAETLGPRGGRRRLLGRLGPDAADPIDELLSLAQLHARSHAPSLQGFVHWLDVQAAEVKREVESGADAVRVMTVHGAKGLQAPIVFLPDTAQVPTRGPALLWGAAPDGTDVVLWPPRVEFDDAFCTGLRAEARRRAAEEYRRLLYVAMTRAEDRLIVCGWRGPKAPPGDNWHALVASAFDRAGLGESVPAEDGEGSVLCYDDPGEPRPEERATPAERTGAEPAWLTAPAPAEPTPSRPLVPSRPVEEAPAPRSPVGDDGGLAFRRGNLIHRLLQTLPDLPPERREAACRQFLALPAHGIDGATQAAWTAETLAVLAAPEAAALFAAPGLAEVPIVGRIGTDAISGTIDRLVVTADAVVILDYKTNRPPPVVEAGVPPAYLRQMAAYRAAIARIYPGRPVRCALLWTDGPRLMWLSDAALAAAMPPGAVP